MSRSVFIETYGCQMNEADTELMFGLLRHRGYTVAENADDADVVLLNTCAVRERAEERVFGRLGWLKSLKERRPEVVLGVAGCMAERLRERLVERAPHVDLVVGPDAYRRLPELIDAGDLGEDAQIDVRLDRRETYHDVEIDRVPGVSGWITVQRGCDKFCTFCVVPFVRGRERSLAPEEVVEQARSMAGEGFREVTLLGQTVSSYYERGHDFADLLRMVHRVEGLHRIRYTSPYPNDFSDRLLDTLAELPRVARHIHLPVQSGSTRVLRDMKRGYTAEATSISSSGCARSCPRTRSAPMSSSDTPARPKKISKPRSRSSARSASTSRSCSTTASAMAPTRRGADPMTSRSRSRRTASSASSRCRKPSARCATPR
ncbi:MAG: MiaB/RimO family radical SAM methylthiotransferase [Myxococcales bacterium]|nr:MiaB/RimO family radical SAM methylthiotransferase [Myxococcales bacterium]